MICVNTGHFTCHNFKPISIKDSSSDIYLTAVVVQRKLLKEHSILCHSKNWGIHYEYMIFLKSGTLYTRQKKKNHQIHSAHFKLPVTWLTVVSWNAFSCLPWWRCFGVTQSNTWCCYWGSSLWGEKHGLLHRFSIELHFFSTCAVSLILDLFTYPYTTIKEKSPKHY